ncbi:LysR family transcriptional regulator [Sphingomonas sp. LH128]|uniref:LysR family transcriptional regulator n=1 Tax=Sphingomonas sp. LH128 TaxID=473781 RepID=UPI00027CC2A1|nr:LysR family transcriptional regulator [Sphingomonas sp. LH128]EJU11950.1 LysR family transcriptional regulator [Sphingomonas sp. LH128]
MELSLTKLQPLVAVARCGSFSRAAGELNLSQPALSRSIAALESRYGFMLFNRVGHGVEPTAAGLQVLEQAKPMLQGLLVFESNLRQLGAGRSGRLAIGMAPLMASQLVPRFAGGFFGDGGEVQLRVMVRPGGELLQALRDDEVELIVFPESHLPETDDIAMEDLGLVRPACVVRRGHPLLHNPALRLEDLAQFPWAGSHETAMPRFPGRSHMVCDNYHILREAVLASDLVCICSHAFVANELDEGTLVEIDIEGLPLRATQIYVAWLKGRASSPLASRAVQSMRAHLAEWWSADHPTGAPP